jgi:acetylornithine deacetylase/succinyl-diaminopimelate desuccinylase-like protein
VISQRHLAPEHLAATVVERTIALAQIPAATGFEERRADVVAGWWEADGWSSIRTDDAGNVLTRIRDGAGPGILLCAHLDTVFPHEPPPVVRNERGRLVGPSVGDNSIAVAALSALGSLLAHRGAVPVWIVATTGEEGLGNLRGIRHVLNQPPEPIGVVIAVEGNYLGRVATTAVGSFRWRVKITGPGGHAWEKADSPSSLHELGRLIVALDALRDAATSTSVNVGRAGGGEAINARARSAWIELDVRAEDPEELRHLEERASKEVGALGERGVEVTVEELGRRPAGRLDPSHPLVQAAVEALARAGMEAELVAASTDANAAFALGIPAITVGVTQGAGEHTAEEWIELAPVATGLQALAQTVALFEREAP